MGVLSNAVELARAEVKRKADSERYFNDPVAWADYMLGATLWSKQKDVAYSVVNNKSTAVKAGHGVGKSYLTALLICWWVDTRYPDCFVVSTAPSLAQVGAILWREVRNMKSLIDERHKAGIIDHRLPGKINSFNEWKTDDGTPIGMGRKPPDNKEESGVQGLHGRVLACGDEACGLSVEMIDALSNVTSNEGSRRVLIGNPTNPGSHFGRIFKEDTGAWSLQTISVLDSPHFTDEGKTLPKEVMDALTGPSYVEDKKKEYGEDSARYKARVLGEFAWDLGDTLIRPEDVAVAYDTEIVPISTSKITLGVDVARFGKDLSAIYLNEGGRLRFLKSFEHNTLTELANTVHKSALDYGVHEVRYDMAGIGAGFEELMWQKTPQPYELIGMNASGETPDRHQWHNARAWWWDSVRKMLKNGEVDIDVSDERLTDEFLSVQYKFNAQSNGLVIESKDDMKKRGQKSPDFADAAIYALFDVEKARREDPPKNQYEDASDILDDMPNYLEMMVQGWMN